jgi:rare lipoprotein A
MIAAVAVAGILIGAAAAAMNLGPTGSDRAAAAVAIASTPGASPSRAADSRGSRSQLREIPSASASPTSTLAVPTTRQPTQPSGSGTVTSSGTCGVSYYSDGQKTADGETFDPNAFTAANKTLPFNTRVRITNPANGKSVVVRINDRGPFVTGRCFDLSQAAFAVIANLSAGVLPAAKYEVLS